MIFFLTVLASTCTAWWGVYSPPPSVPILSQSHLMTVYNGGNLKRAIMAGTNEIFAGDDTMVALAQASASIETSFCQRLSRGEKSGDANDVSCFRMNTGMLKQLGYTQQQINGFNNNYLNSVQHTAKIFAEAVQHYGIDGFMNYHRGGVSRYNQYLSGTLSAKDAADTQSLLFAYQTVQQTILAYNLWNPAWNEKYTDWTVWSYGPVAISVTDLPGLNYTKFNVQ